MNLTVDRYLDQTARWPKEGRHILAQFDDQSIVVYQAYRPGIDHYAAEHGHFGGPEFGYGRMSWIKPNFLWMMYRCGWAAKENQEVVLAVRICREGFDEILRQAVPSTYVAVLYENEAAWQESLRTSNVRLQWDPDHDPHGQKLSRWAIQLGLRGGVLHKYGGPWIVVIEAHHALCDRSASPSDDPERRPSHADRGKALRRHILHTEFSAITAVWSLSRKLTSLARRLMALAT